MLFLVYWLSFPCLLAYLSCAEIQREVVATSDGLDRRWGQDVRRELPSLPHVYFATFWKAAGIPTH